MTRYRHGREQKAADVPRGIRTPFGAAVTPPKPKVPVTDGRVVCPVCGGGVRRVRATYSLVEAGIRQGVTLLIGSHSYGGHAAGRGAAYAPCGGTGLVAEDQS